MPYGIAAGTLGAYIINWKQFYLKHTLISSKLLEKKCWK
jgi:hypothetical protein